MKKLLALVMVLVMALALIACNKNSSTTPDNNTDGAATNTSETTSQDSTEDTTESTLNNQQAIHAHEFTSTVTDPSCLQDGFTTYTCACGENYVSDKVVATGHSFGDWVTTKAPTETATGLAERKCTNCGETESKTLGKVLANHVHDYTGKVTTAATCAKAGVKTFTCACGEKYTETIAKTAHNYKTTTTGVTCTSDGYTTHVCSVCGDTYKNAYTKATGHAYVNTVVDATCTEDGYTKISCTRCNYVHNITIKSSGHSYMDTVVRPTCTVDGYTNYVCVYCDYSYKDSTTKATGHNYVFTSDTATCSSNGVKTETCTKCSNMKTTTTPALAHNTKTETAEATCRYDGYIRERCTVCKTVVSETVFPATGDHEYVTRALSTVSGYSNYTDWDIDICNKCGYGDINAMRFRYTEYEAAVIMLGYVNDLRAEVYGTHDYDLVLDETMFEWAKIRAEEITENYSHDGKPLSCAENICGGGTGIYDHFLGWKNSPGHYANMIDKESKYFGYAFCNTAVGTSSPLMYGVQLFK